METRKINVLGVSVACVTYDSARDIVEQLARKRRATAVCRANTPILAEVRHDDVKMRTWKSNA
jgi:UDP-N-acetyl-D-mannosaminuronic acid transferase (WecB/TagA/CpsF family)